MPHVTRYLTIAANVAHSPGTLMGTLSQARGGIMQGQCTFAIGSGRRKPVSGSNVRIGEPFLLAFAALLRAGILEQHTMLQAMVILLGLAVT